MPCKKLSTATTTTTTKRYCKPCALYETSMIIMQAGAVKQEATVGFV